MQPARPWHENDDFWGRLGPFMFSSQQLISDAAAEVEQAVSLLGIAPEAHILDLCCGVGRHSLELARRGFHVTGVDRTRSYLEQAEEQADKEGLKIVFVHEDMRTFCQPDAFDAVINMFTSFGYFEDPDENRQVVMNVYRSLKSGGVFLLEMVGKEVMARLLQREWHEEDGALILYEGRPSQNWSWIEHRWIAFEGDKRNEFRVTHRLYSATELTALLAGCGFAQVDAYGDLSGGAYDHTAKTLVMVARK